MTVCLYLNGGVPILITDTLQSKPGTVVFSPENCNFINQKGRLKALKCNQDGDVNIKVEYFPLTRKWKVFEDNVVIAFTGQFSEVSKFIARYGDFINNKDESGAVVEKIKELLSLPGAPMLNYAVIAPDSEHFRGLIHDSQNEFWPFDSYRVVGSGAGYIKFMYEHWLKTQIGTPACLEDRGFYIMIARDFLLWLNGHHILADAPYTLRRYRQKSGRTFGGFFQGIVYFPEEERWRDLSSISDLGYARVSRPREGKGWSCSKLVVDVLRDMDREVHVTCRDEHGTLSKKIFPIEDPFGSFRKFDNVGMPNEFHTPTIKSKGLNVMVSQATPSRTFPDMRIDISQHIASRIEAATQKIKPFR